MHYLEEDFNYQDQISFKTYRTLEELIPEEKKIYKALMVSMDIGLLS